MHPVIRIEGPYGFSTFTVCHVLLHPIALATQVDVIVAATENRLNIIIDDDGRRFPRALGADDVPEHQIALPGMRESLALLGGSLEIEASPGKGRTLFISIPLS